MAVNRWRKARILAYYWIGHFFWLFLRWVPWTYRPYNFFMSRSSELDTDDWLWKPADPKSEP